MRVNAEIIWIFTAKGIAETATISGENKKIDLRYGVIVPANQEEPHLKKKATQRPEII